MAFRKTLAQGFFSASKPSSLFRPKAAASPSLLQRLLQNPPPTGRGVLRRVLVQSRSIFQLPAIPPERLGLPIGDKLVEKLRGLNGDRIRLDSLAPPILRDLEEGNDGVGRALPISVEEARKLVRVAQTEAVKARLRGVGRSSIPYPEFVRICCEGSNREQGMGLTRALDESGAVLVLGDVVFLRPEQVARAIERALPAASTPGEEEEEDPARREELREMERRKAEIDGRAKAGVRREMWWGLAFLAAQTAGFFRLTFWELSWDVMEPICFFVTSAYFMAGYNFFLRTSRDPSFEGFFLSRFAVKQRRLMRAAGFDLRRLHELRRDFSTSAPSTDGPCPPFHHHRHHNHHHHHQTATTITCDCCHHHQHRRDALLGAV